MADRLIDIGQAREKKAAMEEVIRQVIEVFEVQTGCTVESVNIERAMTVGNSGVLVGVKTEVSL